MIEYNVKVIKLIQHERLNMFIHKEKLNSEKELELMSTLMEFLSEMSSFDGPYDKEVAKIWIAKETKIIEDFNKYNLDMYYNQVDEGLFMLAKKIKELFVSLLKTGIAEDYLAINDETDTSEYADLMHKSREIEYELKECIKLLSGKTEKIVKRFKKQHHGKEPGSIEEFSIRNKLSSTK